MSGQTSYGKTDQRNLEDQGGPGGQLGQEREQLETERLGGHVSD